MLLPRTIVRFRVSVLCCLMLVAAGFAVAQSAPASEHQSSSNDWAPSGSSSSSDLKLPQFAEISSPDGLAALPSAPTPAASAASSGGGQDNGGWRHSLVSKYALELGGGFNAPISNGITYGGNFTVGGGVNFSKRLAALVEYQFIDDKLPGSLIAATQGADGGHAHIWSFTVDPVVSLFPSSTNDVYVTGGGGFYRKVTIFTVLSPTEFCSYFGCGIGYAPATVGHFSSNQGGFNIGGGYQRHMGGMYGDSKMKLFAEVRFVEVMSPAIVGQSANGLAPVSIPADTKVLPVTLGLRW